YGNLLTVPVGDELMYVEPIYASLSTASESTFPILRYVLVSYRGGVGIDTTLTNALEKARANAEDSSGPDTGTPTPTPSDEPSPTDTPTGHVSDDVAGLLAQAQEEFVLADQALSNGDLSEFQDHYDKARDLVAQAVALEGGNPTGSPAPSGSSSSSSP